MNDFDSIPRFDARDFEPPAWANGPAFQWERKNGESSSSKSNAAPMSGPHHDDASSSSPDTEEWADASEGHSIDPDLATFTIGELKVGPTID